VDVQCPQSRNTRRKEDDMAELQDVAYCGLYCRLCATKSRIPKTATALRDALAKEGWPHYGEYIVPGFNSFWSTLVKFADYETACPDCRGGCGDPGCGIRKCAKDRTIDLCPLCPEYPCTHIRALARRYPNLVADGERMKEIGVEAWVKEQEDRRSTGFCYCDIRFPQREVAE
jgi:hypothetical protein